MIYEFILTTKCNRNCAFCYVKKSAFFASKEDVDVFYECIKKEKTSYYELSLFGGEPLLNFDVLCYCVEKFYNEPCKIVLYTNGDLLYKLQNKQKLNSRIIFSITVYDIFVDIKKYRDILKQFHQFRNNIIFKYTFTENDIKYIKRFRYICKFLNVNYKIAFSHNLDSWNSISVDVLKEIITEYFNDEFNELLKNNRENFLCRYYGRILEFIFNKNALKDISCLDCKKTFINGKFIGSCLGMLNTTKKIVNNNCKKCMYNIVCFKSCVIEYIDGEVPEKLCLFEKIGYDTAIKFIKNNPLFFKRLVQKKVDK